MVCHIKLEDLPRLIKTLTSSGWQLEEGNSHSNKALLGYAYAICEKTIDQDVEDLVCDIHYSLGAVSNETNDGDTCFKHNTAFLDIRLKKQVRNKKPDLRLGIAHNQMGTAWMMMGDFEKAAMAFQEAMNTYQILPDFTPYLLTIPIANLGLARWSQGRLDEAYEVLERERKDRESMFGKNDHESFR